MPNAWLTRQTANIDRIGREGMVFTDQYGQNRCTAGRAAFILLDEPGVTGDTVGMDSPDNGGEEMT